MRYNEARPLIRSGDVIATTHKDWNSLYDLMVMAVRVGTMSEFCHVGLVWEVGGRLFVIEAVTPKVRLVPLSHFAPAGFYWLPLDTPISDPELEHAMSKVGVAEYSRWQAILGGLKRLSIGTDDSAQCAEFVIECRRLSGVDLGDVATPAEVVEAALARGAPMRLVKGA
jgi:hypothetical protein